MNSIFYSDLELIKQDRQQYEAFTSMQNTAVIAGPGSGKTRLLIFKAITIAKNQIHKPCGLACISFSRESVRELKKRLQLYGYRQSNRDFIGTVHSFSLLHVIQPFAHLYSEYDVKYPVKILPYEISDQIYEGVLKDLGIVDRRQLTLVEINKHRSLSIVGRSTVQIDSTKIIAQAANRYEARLHETVYIDFIDIINVSARIIREQEYVRNTLRSQFPWLLVDEYQDLGKALHEMVLELVFNAGIKLYGVGDVNQSIYGFNGGYPDFLNELTTYEDINTVYLVANYRSSQAIIDASLEALQPTPPPPKYTAEKRKEEIADFSFITCEEEMEEQYEVVSRKVIPNLLARGIPLSEIGIITSSNSQIREMAFYLEKRKIPFFIVNWTFENSAVVVWLQECAMWCTDREKQSFTEVFTFWKRLIFNHDDPRKNWESIRLKTFFYGVLADTLNTENLLDWINSVVDRLELRATLGNSEIYPNEVENLEALLDEARLHNLKNSNLKRFANLGFPENEITITTRHSSKGLEFEAVVLLAMEEGHFPNYYHLGNPSALAEDQRLCYVCISRAKQICILVRSKFFTIETRRGPWRKDFSPSRYWVSLHEKFGNKRNTFTDEDY